MHLSKIVCTYASRWVGWGVGGGVSGATNRKLPIVYVIMLIKYFQQFLKLFSELEYKCPIEICEGGRPRGRLRPTEICVARPSSIG